MPRNVEIKAKVERLSDIRRLVEEIADSGPIELHQVDTFFNCPGGRLKLRVFADSSGELIYYQRTDVAGPRESQYRIHPTADPASLMQILTAAWGVRGVVEKKRTVYLVGQTRVHLDDVRGLGTFVELEVVLREDQDVDEGVAVAEALMSKLQIAPHSLVEKPYIDLLGQRGGVCLQ